MQNEDLIDMHILSWIAQLQKLSANNTPLDLASWIQWFAKDVNMDAVFGDPVGFVDAGKDVSNLIRSVQNVFLMGNILSLLLEVVTFLQLPPIWSWVAPKPSDKGGIGFMLGVGIKAIRKRPEDGNVAQRRDVLQRISRS